MRLLLKAADVNTRELLTLAAKAAGIEVVEQRSGGLPWTIRVDGKSYPWNPLTDDGDAFRLAVKLNMQIVITGYELEGVGITDCKAGLGKWAGGSLHNGDPLTATRLAIVRAAAEIGKAMP